LIILAQKAEHDGLFSNLTGGRAGRLRRMGFTMFRAC